MNDPLLPVADTRQPETWVTLAHLLRPQGRKGELLAELLTDFPERFADRRGIALRSPGGAITPATVESHWLPVGRNAGRVVLKLLTIESIDDAARLAEYDLVVAAADRVSLDTLDDAGEYAAQYIADLIDCTVFDGNVIVGTVHDVHFPTNATGARLDDAVPLLVVHTPEGDEILIPFARAWIQTIDIPGRLINMSLPEGLLDINS